MCTGTRPRRCSTPHALERARRPARRGRPARCRHRRATPAARRRTSSSCASRAPRTGSGGATSTGRSRRSTSTGCARRSPTHLGAQRDLYVIDAFAGADPRTASPSASSPSSPYHALFARTMFIDPTEDELDGVRAAGARAARASRSRPIPDDGRHPHRHLRRAPPDAAGGADRRHVLRRRDQEVDLHGDERPAAARGRLPDALLGERRRRRRRRRLLRALGHRQDDALGRSRAAR